MRFLSINSVQKIIFFVGLVVGGFYAFWGAGTIVSWIFSRDDIGFASVAEIAGALALMLLGSCLALCYVMRTRNLRLARFGLVIFSAIMLAVHIWSAYAAVRNFGVGSLFPIDPIFFATVLSLAMVLLGAAVLSLVDPRSG